MSRRLLSALVFAVFLGTSSSGCILHSHGHRHKSHAVKGKKHKKRKKCPPSHYWDGNKCRHKGKGKGARKHDH